METGDIPSIDKSRPSRLLAWFALCVLVIAYICAFIDKMIISLLVIPIRADLGLSDTQISLLQGLSFAIFFAFAGLPLGRLVDRSNRVWIASIGIATWSLMTTFCAFAQNFWQLFILRMGVGAGEASITPAAYSLIPDYFEGENLGLAMGIFSFGATLGVGLSFMIGGQVVEFASSAGSISVPIVGTLRSWQFVFLIVGLPGLLVAGFMLLVPEPRAAERNHVDDRQHPDSVAIKDVMAFFIKNRRVIFLHHFSLSMASMAAWGIMSWTPAYAARSLGWSPSMIGTLLGASIAIFGVIGVIGGGWLGDRLIRAGDQCGRLTASSLAMVLSFMGAVTFPFLKNPILLALAFGIHILGAWMIVGNGAALLQQIFPDRLRGQGAATYMLAINLIGVGLGPTSVALLTDYVFEDTQMLKYSLLMAPPAAIVLASIAFLLLRTPMKELIDRRLTEAAGVRR